MTDKDLYEWAVNDTGDVMLAMPRFYIAKTMHATVNGSYLNIKYDGHLTKRVFILPNIIDYIKNVPTLLLVTFDANGDIDELDLKLKVYD